MKVLFVSEIPEDQEQLQRILKNIHKELDLLVAKTLDEAMDIVSTDGPFGFFIIDAEMKKSDPNQLAINLTEFAGERPIIFLGHDAIIADRIAQETFDANESNEKIAKPISRDDFLSDFTDVTSSALKWAKDEEFATSIEDIDPDDFVKMKIKSFYLYTIFPYDIYLEFTPTQYIKIISANKPYTITTLSTYAKKNIKTLCIRKDDQLKYLEDEAKKCLKGLRKINLDGPDVFIVTLRSITIMHQYMLALGVSPTVLTLANAITDTIIAISGKYRTLKSLLKVYPHLYEGIASKSLITGFLSAYLCRHMGWDSITTKKKLAIASILQDYNLPDESLSKINQMSDPRLTSFNEASIKKFVEHPAAIAEIARQFTMFPDIDFLIESHHELPNRKGFPNQPTLSKLTAINAVFNIAQYVAAEIDGYQYSSELNNKVLRSMNRDFNAGNFKEPLKILKGILGPKVS